MKIYITQMSKNMWEKKIFQLIIIIIAQKIKYSNSNNNSNKNNKNYNKRQQKHQQATQITNKLHM